MSESSPDLLDCFSAAMEAEVCRRVLGERRFGYESAHPADEKVSSTARES